MKLLKAAWVPYVAPMIVYLGLNAVEGVLPKVGGQPHPAWYPLVYGLKVVATALTAWLCRSTWRDLRPLPGVGGWILGIGLGVAVAAMWVAIDPYYPRTSWLGSRSAYDPSTLPHGRKLAFEAVRLIGLVLVVPPIEELFWRSFLMRWIIDEDFAAVPVGRVTRNGALATSVLFALAHPEWLAALLTGLAWAWLLWRTRSLAACAASHVAANLSLGIYVLLTGEWRFL